MRIDDEIINTDMLKIVACNSKRAGTADVANS